MMCDDGQLTETLESADIVLLGVTDLETRRASPRQSRLSHPPHSAGARRAAAAALDHLRRPLIVAWSLPGPMFRFAKIVCWR